MVRSLFFAGGLFVALWGGSFLMVDEVVLTIKEDPKEEQRDDEFRGLFMSKDANNRQVFNPPEWAAFSLMSIGTVTMLYAVALPKRN
ncbi:MAG: hypothetical protein O2820_12400 [Planctomycetota bacterium]|nr:hypothetical protein [Planctomycetota bacterium]MDA1250013.1 hypothetical protein [Planctomycetota bacterium]